MQGRVFQRAAEWPLKPSASPARIAIASKEPASQMTMPDTHPSSSSSLSPRARDGRRHTPAHQTLGLALATALLATCPAGAWVNLATAGTNAQGCQEVRNTFDDTVLVRIPGGSFTMGSTAMADQRPPHPVSVASFYMARTPVTNAQFQRFVAATGYKPEGDWEACARRWGPKAPVVRMSYPDATAYASWAGMRLPTEAEWEYAARGTDGRTYPWGAAWDPQRCRSSMGGGGFSAGSPAPVGSYPSGASPFGCLDMAGNVLQWCSSRYQPYPYDAADGREDAGAADVRVQRGGAWYLNFYAGYFSTTYRYNGNPQVHDPIGWGFRCALSQS